jgi:protein-S-isoprenylcysteine O-methyltransferase Ste14
MAIRGRFDAVDRDVLREHAMGWAVKGFFLPIMVIYLLATFDRMQLNLDMLQGGQVSAIRWLVDLVSCAELAIVCVGYTLTLRALDSHIRSTNPYLVGWLVTLACYQPFNHIVSGGILAYSDGRYWFDWFGTDPVLSSLWCAALLASFGVWLWATAAFGLRWSNLTNRGIITNGPYRFTKHPDYLSKSIFFWLINVPFLSEAGPVEALRACLLLGLINVIYFLRARTEERHLADDPDYVAYASAMNERSIFRRLGRLFPLLRFRARPAVSP